MSKKKEQMYSLVEIWQSGTQSKTAYCQSIQINIHTFTYWVQKYKKEKDGLRLRLQTTPDIKYLESLIRITI